MERREGGRDQRSPLSVITLLFSAATLKRKLAGKSVITHFSTDTYAAWNAPTHTADIIAAFLRNASKNVRCDCKQRVCKCIFQAYLYNTAPEVSFIKYSLDPLFTTKEKGGSGERGAEATWILYLWTPVEDRFYRPPPECFMSHWPVYVWGCLAKFITDEGLNNTYISMPMGHEMYIETLSIF